MVKRESFKKRKWGLNGICRPCTLVLCSSLWLRGGVKIILTNFHYMLIKSLELFLYFYFYGDWCCTWWHITFQRGWCFTWSYTKLLKSPRWPQHLELLQPRVHRFRCKSLHHSQLKYHRGLFSEGCQSLNLLLWNLLSCQMSCQMRKHKTASFSLIFEFCNNDSFKATFAASTTCIGFSSGAKNWRFWMGLMRVLQKCNGRANFNKINQSERSCSAEWQKFTEDF